MAASGREQCVGEKFHDSYMSPSRSSRSSASPRWWRRVVFVSRHSTSVGRRPPGTADRSIWPAGGNEALLKEACCPPLVFIEMPRIPVSRFKSERCCSNRPTPCCGPAISYFLPGLWRGWRHGLSTVPQIEPRAALLISRRVGRIVPLLWIIFRRKRRLPVRRATSRRPGVGGPAPDPDIVWRPG